MAEERKLYLKYEIINAIRSLLLDNDYSLEELEEGYATLNTIIVNTDDLTLLQEDIDDK